MKLRHYQAYHEQNVVIRCTVLLGVLHFQAYKKFSGISSSNSTQNGMMPVYKKPVNQPSQIWQENGDRTIQDGHAEARHDI